MPRTWFKFALKQSPNDLNLRAVVTVWALENGDIALAKEQAKEALRIEARTRRTPRTRSIAGSTAGRMLSGYVAIWDKNWQEAQDYFEQRLPGSPQRLCREEQPGLGPHRAGRSARRRTGPWNMPSATTRPTRTTSRRSTLSWIYFKQEKYDLASLAMDAVIRATGGNVANPIRRPIWPTSSITTITDTMD